MNTIHLTQTPPSRSVQGPQSVSAHSGRAPTSRIPPFRQRLDEIVPLVGFVPVAGPPVILIVGPWLLLVLMLVGPFMVLVTLAAIALCATVLVALIVAILATPYLLARRLHRRRAAKASSPLLVHRLVQAGQLTPDRAPL